jgi:hypothetical protein
MLHNAPHTSIFIFNLVKKQTKLILILNLPLKEEPRRIVFIIYCDKATPFFKIPPVYTLAYVKLVRTMVGRLATPGQN